MSTTEITITNSKEIVEFLNTWFAREKEARYRNGIYGFTQRALAYNSNKIEGSTLTEEQTYLLLEKGFLPQSDDVYRAKDIEEMTGHFIMFNTMLDTMDEALSQELIKRFHYELKAGVFEDRANGYAIGDYKKRANRVGMYDTTLPEDVPQAMDELLIWYGKQEISLDVLAEFHAKYEIIHPFQDGNGRTGRIILFRECLKNDIVPVIIQDINRMNYIEGLKEYRDTEKYDKLLDLFIKEQKCYYEHCLYFYVNNLK